MCPNSYQWIATSHNYRGSKNTSKLWKLCDCYVTLVQKQEFWILHLMFYAKFNYDHSNCQSYVNTIWWRKKNQIFFLMLLLSY